MATRVSSSIIVVLDVVCREKATTGREIVKNVA